MARLNGRTTFFLALITAASLAGCGSSASSSTAPASTGSASTGSASTAPACETGSLQLVGSTAFLPIAQDVATAYMRDCPGVTISVSGGDSAYGLTKVRDVVAAASGPIGSIIAMYDGLPSASSTTGLSAYPVGVLIYSVVAHTGFVPSENLSTAQLRAYFTKPGHAGTVAVGRRAGSGSRGAFVTNVLGVNPGPPDKGNCPVPNGRRYSFTSCTEDSTADLLNFVNQTPNAVGYAEVLGPLVDYPQVSVISIDGATPTAASVRNGSYKFWTVEHLYAAAVPTTLAQDFLAFVPQYTTANPASDFIPCSDALTSLGAAC